MIEYDIQENDLPQIFIDFLFNSQNLNMMKYDIQNYVLSQTNVLCHYYRTFNSMPIRFYSHEAEFTKTEVNIF